jgi:hypothetical protein
MERIVLVQQQFFLAQQLAQDLLALARGSGAKVLQQLAVARACLLA